MKSGEGQTRTLTASGMFSELIEIQNPPEVGVFLKVEFEPIPPSEALQYYLGAQVVFYPLFIFAFIPGLTILPYYTDEGGTAVSYTLYRDGQLQRIYSYPITKKGAGWIALLPFAWLNFFTNDLKDAVRGTTLQFLIDTQRDGYL